MSDVTKVWPPLPDVLLSKEAFDDIDAGYINRFHADDRLDWIGTHWPSVVSTVWKLHARLATLEKVLESAEAFLASLPQHYHGFPGKLEWPEVHALRQRVEAIRAADALKETR